MKQKSLTTPGMTLTCLGWLLSARAENWFKSCMVLLWLAPGAYVGNYIFSVDGDQVKLNGKTFKVIGLRCSNALISPEKTQELIDNLDTYKSCGINTVSVYLMGSRFGDIKGYDPDASLNSTYALRLGRIIEAADKRGMIVLVGCLYWGSSSAKKGLEGWGQEQANAAVANTVSWLVANNYRNVFVDPDNEGMSSWSIKQMIDAAHAVDPSIMVAANETNTFPPNADLFVHHSPKIKGKPWIETEGYPEFGGNYWDTFSKQTYNNTGGRYYNYSRIGRYNEGQKNEIYKDTAAAVSQQNGYMFSSTWLQCAPSEGIGGPFMSPGGNSNIEDTNRKIDVLHEDAGVKWWLDYVRITYGAWVPPVVSSSQR